MLIRNIVLFFAFSILFNLSTLFSNPLWQLFDDPEFFGTKYSPYSNVVKASFIDDKGNIYVGVWGSGIYKSTNNGNTWQAKNNGLSNLFINTITANKNGNIIVGTHNGIFISTNRGDSWSNSSTGLQHNIVNSIVKHQNNWLFAGTFGGGVYISKDDGANWQHTSKGLYYRNITSLTITNNAYVVAGTYGGGIYVTRDTGKTWIEQNTGLNNLYINYVMREPSGAIVAATNGDGVYESPNDGLSWARLDTFMTRPYTLIRSPLPDLNITTLNINRNRKLVFGSRFGGLFYDDDVEDFTWVPSNIRGTGVNNILTDKNGNMFAFVNEKQPQYTTTLGETWEEKPIIVENLSPKLFILGKKHLLIYDKQGNFIVSNNDGLTWNKVATLGFPLNAVCRDSSGRLFAASQRGLYFSEGSGTDWVRIRFTDTTVHDVEVGPNGYVWVTTTYAPEPPPGGQPQIYRNVFVSTDGGFNWKDVTMNLSGYNQTPQKIAINKDGNVYCALNNIFFYTNDNGLSWRKTNNLGNDMNNIEDVAIDKSGTIFAATLYGLYKSINPNTFSPVPLFMTVNNLVHVDRNGNIYGSGSYQLPNNFAYINLSYRSLDTGQTFSILNNSYNADKITSITSDYDGDIYFTTESGLILKSIYPPSLKAPKLVNLPNKAFDVPNNPTLSWNKVNEAELYQLQVSKDEEFIFRFEFVTLGDTSYQLNQIFEPNTKYYWRVRAKNNSVVSDWSEVRTFNTKLATPVLHLPSNNGTGVRVYAQLHWYPVIDAIKYEVLVSKSNNFKDTVFYKNNVTDTTITTSILEGLTKYYWKVRALNDKSSSLWSETWSFNTVLGPPKLISPKDNQNGVSINVNLVWNKAIQAESYKIILAEDENFSINKQELTSNDTTILVSNLAYDKWYWWKVSSKNKDGESEYSTVWKFRTAYSPVILLSPENNKRNLKIPVTLKWEKHVSQNKYELQIAESIDFKLNSKVIDNLEEKTDTVFNSLKYYTDYYWKVRVFSNENIGEWSETFNFRTTLGKAGLRLPLDKSKGLPTEISFLWFNLNGATKYHLQISRDINFEDLVFSQDTLTSVNIIISNLPPNQDMYWRVRGVSNDGYGEWSDVWTFSTAGNAPKLYLPKNGQTNVKLPLKFEWERFANTKSFKLYVSENSNFDVLVIKEDELVENQYYLNELLLKPNTTYYWKVQVNLENGETSNWSQTWTFVTDVSLDIDINDIISKILLSPNPANNMIKLSFNIENEGYYKLYIYDMTGRIVNIDNFGYLEQGNYDKYIKLDKLISGKYFISIISNNIKYESEFIIEK